MASAMQSSALKGNMSQSGCTRTIGVVPFRAAGNAGPRRQRAVVTQAAQECAAPSVGKKALAAFAAAAVALTPFAANAAGPDLGGLVDKAEAAKDKVAGAVKDAAGGSAGGNVQGAAGDAKSAAGSIKQAGQDIATKPVAFNSSGAGLQVNVAAPSLGGLADKAKAGVDKAAGAAKDATGNPSGKLQGAAGDAKSAAGSLKQGTSDIATKPVAFSGRTGLQVNVGLPSAGGLADKAKAGVDKAAGAAKDAAGNPGGKLQGAAGDAKSAAGTLKQGTGDIATKPVAFSGSRAGLQVDVGLPSAGGLADKAKAGVDKVAGAAKDATGNPGGKLQGAAGNAKSAGGSLKQGTSDIATKPVAFGGSRAGLQVNVGLTSAGGLADKAKAGVDKATGAAKDAAGNPGGKLQGAAGDAKSAAGGLKQGTNDVATKPVAFSGSRTGLQVNVGLPSAGGLADKAKAGLDKAAGAAKDATGNPSGKLQGAAGDAKSAAGSLKQGNSDIATKPVEFAGRTNLQVNVGLPSTGGLADKAKAGADKVAGAAKDATGNPGSKLQGAAGDAKSAAGSLKQGSKDIATKPVAFSGSNAAGLQVDISNPNPAGLADKDKSSGDKVGASGADGTGDARGAAQGASGDAKTIDAARKGKQALNAQSNVAFRSSTSSLQMDVANGVFGRGDVGTQKDQIDNAGEEIKDAVTDPARNAKNAADRTGQVAERVLSNPTGGPEQSKRAAAQLADANAEVPKALARGAQKAKDAITSPASFDIFSSGAMEALEA